MFIRIVGMLWVIEAVARAFEAEESANQRSGAEQGAQRERISRSRPLGEFGLPADVAEGLGRLLSGRRKIGFAEL